MISIAEQRAELERILNADRGPSRFDHLRDLQASRAASSPSPPTRIKAVAQVAPHSETISGEFSALISDWSVDHDGERFDPHAWDRTVADIRKAGRAIPVLYGHTQQNVDAMLGYIPSDGLWVDAEGLHAKGWIDTVDPIGARVWRMLKNDALKWSVGFVPLRSRLDGKTPVITEARLHEVSVVPLPSNQGTRTDGVKSAAPPPTAEELRERCRALGIPTNDSDRRRTRTRRAIFELLTGKAEEPRVPTHIELEARLIRQGLIAPLATDHEHLDERASESGSVTLHDRNGHGSIADREEKKSHAGQTIRIASFEC
jgi:HK97 family phage prohead protease